MTNRLPNRAAFLTGKMMKKHLSFLLAAGLSGLVLLSAAACAQHTHSWIWHRTETEHVEVCTGCGAERNAGEHEHFVCEDCAEFRALGIGYTGSGGDPAHADFAREANAFFAEQGEALGFLCDSAENFSVLTAENLEKYDILLFFNDRPHEEAPQKAFRDFMENGGAWIGFHSAAYVQEVAGDDYWEWYQDDFLGCGNYKNNTWNPTSERLTVETHDHVATAALPDGFLSAPCEWYGWEHDLFENPEITVLITLNPTPEEPAGDNPDKPYEIWTSGHYPIVWANNNYKMLYTNMGHNLQDYNTYEKQSETFSCEEQRTLILDAMFGFVS